MRKGLNLLVMAALYVMGTACGTAPGGQASEGQLASVPVVAPTEIPQSNVKNLSDIPAIVDATPTPATSISDCPVTQPQSPPFKAPPPYSASAPWPRYFWYGTEQLWTVIPANGTGSSVQKLLWWRQGYSWKDDPTPQLTVTGRRLDGPAPPLNAHEATNAFAEDIQSAMLVGADFPTPGCWEITGRLPHQQLSYVVWIEF